MKKTERSSDFLVEVHKRKSTPSRLKVYLEEQWREHFGNRPIPFECTAFVVRRIYYTYWLQDGLWSYKSVNYILADVPSKLEKAEEDDIIIFDKAANFGITQKEKSKMSEDGKSFRRKRVLVAGQSICGVIRYMRDKGFKKSVIQKALVETFDVEVNENTLATQFYTKKEAPVYDTETGRELVAACKDAKDDVVKPAAKPKSKKAAKPKSKKAAKKKAVVKRKAR